jgi:hypothetical protein
METKIKKIRVGRRTFVKLLSAIGVTAASKISLSLKHPRRHQRRPNSGAARHKEMMHDTEKLIGIELTDAQEAMASAASIAISTLTKLCARSTFHSTRSRRLLSSARARKGTLRTAHEVSLRQG